MTLEEKIKEILDKYCRDGYWHILPDDFEAISADILTAFREAGYKSPEEVDTLLVEQRRYFENKITDVKVIARREGYSEGKTAR